MENSSFRVMLKAWDIALTGNMVLRSLFPSYKIQTQEIKHSVTTLTYILQLEVILFLAKNHVTFFKTLAK